MKFNTKTVALYSVIYMLSLVAGVVLTQMPDKRIATETVVQEDEALYIPSGEEMSGDKININTASAKTLMLLDGIGEKLSERIIEYRTKNGEFRTIENIMDVSGIGESLYNDIKDKICVD